VYFFIILFAIAHKLPSSLLKNQLAFLWLKNMSSTIVEGFKKGKEKEERQVTI